MHFLFYHYHLELIMIIFKQTHMVYYDILNPEGLVQLYLMTKILIVLLGLMVVVRSCPGNYFNYQMAADVVDLVPSSPTQTIFTYTFKTSFSAVPQVTAGVSSLSITRIDEKIPFAVYVIPTSSTNIVQIRTAPPQGLWVVRQLTVLATLQPELLLDTVSGQIWSSSAQTSTQNAVFKLNQRNKFGTQQKLIVRTYLAGISTPTALSYLLLVDSWLQNDQLIVQITTKEVVSAQLWISLVAFPVQSVAFSAYGGTASIDSQNVSHYDLYKNMAAPQNSFFGINGISLGGSLPQNIEIKVSIDHNFILSLTKTGSFSSFQFSYLFLGLPGDQVCLNCILKGEGNAYSNGSCYTSCPQNTVKVPIGNGYFCRECPSSMGIGFKNNQCVPCGTGTIAQNGLCVPINSQNSQSTSTVISQNIINRLFTNQNGNSQQNSQSSGGTSSVSCPFSNMFWNGEGCACLVGYRLINNLCVPISIDPNFFVPDNSFNGQTNSQKTSNTSNATVSNQSQGGQVNIVGCTGENQYFNGVACICKPGFTMINNSCSSCPLNSQWNGLSCLCRPGYYSLGGACVTSSTSCPFGSVNNGLGVCICQQQGYQLVNNACQFTSCPKNKLWNGTTCICPSSYVSNPDSSCEPPCPNGTLYLSSSKTCITICLVNNIYDPIQQRCRCVDGLAIGQNNLCTQCPSQYYIYNGYCVVCPLNSIRSIYGYCQCSAGYVTSLNGMCSPKCSSVESYNSVNGQCECRVGLVRSTSTGLCQPCMTGSSFVNGGCIMCPPNAAMLNSKCVCSSGYIMSGNSCLECWKVPNTFIREGKCVVCLNNQYYNVNTGQCQCQNGFVLKGSSCVLMCSGDELLDREGRCYSCPVNMVYSNGLCICSQGYTKTGCGCELKCQGSQFIFQGRCGQCPLNMVYSPLFQGCSCPQGYYYSSIFSLCLSSPGLPLTCPIGQYISNITKSCKICSSHCLNCNENNTCLVCEAGYNANSTTGLCNPICGDGIVVAGEQCDSYNWYDPGCMGCIVSWGYNCVGQPSVCSPVSVPPSPPPVPPPPQQNSTLALTTNPSISSNNIFITLKTTPTFTFPDDNTMKQFIQSSFTDVIKPTVYCLQRPAPNLSFFDCLLIYPSGVPNRQFNIDFSYNYQGRIASTKVNVNPFNYVSAQIRN